MKKQKRAQSKLTKEQRQAKRRVQVRRQKILLCALPLLLFCILLIVFRLNRKEPLPAINEACESYRSDVERLAAQYGMSDYVDLLLALMMQESSGIGPDVMQSSEGAYNTKYPQEPGGITDTEYSIACGIQELKYAMDRAGVTSPTDMEHIKLALQAYNFGADVYMDYMEKRAITPGLKRVLKPLPKWQAAKRHVQKMIRFSLLLVLGIMETKIIQSMYCDTIIRKITNNWRIM